MDEKSQTHQESAPKPELEIVLTEEAAMLAKLMHHDEDAEGLLAFALHRRAVLDWVAAFQEHEHRAPHIAELRQFLLGEAAPRRMGEYRERASVMVAVERTGKATPDVQKKEQSAKAEVSKTMMWPFGPGLGFAVEQPGRSLNWKALLLRLVLLMIAVIVTALMLRFFVVNP